MTEREYVETIRKAAEAYVNLGYTPATTASTTAASGEFWEWQQAMRRLPAPMAIALCDAWLTMQETVE